MPDGGAQPNPSAADRSAVERQRAEELRQSQLLALRDAAEAPSRADISDDEDDAGEETIGDEEAEDYGDDDEGSDPVERLRQSQATAAIAGMIGGGTGGAASAGDSLDPSAQLQTQIDKVNHYLLVEILPEVVALDVSCFGLSTVITLPFVYWPTAALWGLEVYNDFTGNSTPLTPKLSWKSFFPPGTDIDIPILTNQPLYVIWLAYVILLGLMTVIWGTLIFLAIYTIHDPAAALSGLKEFFPFMTSILGV